MKTVYIGLGSNLGDSLELLQSSWSSLGKSGAINPVALSSPYRTRPVGMESANWFINAVGCLETSLSPVELLDVLLALEVYYGRKRSQAIAGYQDRTLDLDILLFGDMVLNSERLIIPHSQLQQRLFVLAPLVEIGAQVLHPVLKRRISSVFADLGGRSPEADCEKMSWPDSIK